MGGEEGGGGGGGEGGRGGEKRIGRHQQKEKQDDTICILLKWGLINDERGRIYMEDNNFHGKVNRIW